MTDWTGVLLGDSRVNVGCLSPNTHVLAEKDTTLAEIIAVQLPLTARRALSAITVAPGVRDILDGHDESYVHAHLVELLDGILRAHPRVSVQVHGFPPITDPRLDLIRRQCDGSARAAAEQRGMTWRPTPEDIT